VVTIPDRQSPSGDDRPREARPFWRKHFFKLTLLPLGAIAALWFLVIRPQISKTVDEPFPATAPAPTTVSAAQPVATTAPVTLAPAAAGPMAVKSGTFVKVEHDGSGKATIFKQPDGSYILRLENLDITNGPDLRVRLLGPNGASLDLGGLKGNKGNQNYEIPAGFDPATYDTADVWCRAFRVQFSKAALS